LSFSRTAQLTLRCSLSCCNDGFTPHLHRVQKIQQRVKKTTMSRDAVYPFTPHRYLVSLRTARMLCKRAREGTSIA
jgi:hypothetical protein